MTRLKRGSNVRLIGGSGGSLAYLTNAGVLSAYSIDESKAEKISIGMTKDQVKLSWGNPDSTSVVSGSGITVETWGYGLKQYVTFTNGKVSQVYTL